MPADIELALNGLTFQSVHPDTVDTVTITLYDGKGGLCLTNAILGIFIDQSSRYLLHHS